MELVDSFHFARPWALLLIPVLILQVLWYLRFRHASNPWQQQMRPDLQQHLLAEPAPQPRYLLWILMSLILAGTALAGPSWSQQSRPVLSKQDNLVIVLDLSLSMLAEDLPPNRITRARQKLHDLLEQRNEGMTALVAYAGAAHTVTPLTRDTATIRNLLPALDPQLMPLPGSAAEKGIEKARQLIQQSGLRKARLLLVTDGLEPEAMRSIRRQLTPDLSLSLMTVGTAQGAPIPVAGQNFVKDTNGNVIISQLDEAGLGAFARDVSARIHPITLSNRDLDYLLEPDLVPEAVEEQEVQAPVWIEQGHWFLLPVIPLAALVFRRNWLMLIPLLLILPVSAPVYALWPQSPQQAGEQAFQQGEYDKAEQLLQDPLWLGSTHYRQGNYEQAISEFAQHDSAQAHYNRGNALARLGRLDEAINAYSQALERDPQLADAEYNRQLVQQLRQQQEKEQQQKQQQQPNEQQNQQQQSDNQGTPQSGQPQQQGGESSGSDPQNGAGSDAGTRGMPQPRNDGSQNNTRNSAQTPDNEPGSEADNTASTPGAPEQAGTENQPGAASPDKRSTAASPDTEQPGTDSGGNASLSEAELSLEQWLRRIPDDPAGLLRRKFEYEAHQQQASPSNAEGRTSW